MGQLKGLHIKEVSLVDRAANKRKHLLLKREKGELGMLTAEELKAKEEELNKREEEIKNREDEYEKNLNSIVKEEEQAPKTEEKPKEEPAPVQTPAPDTAGKDIAIADLQAKNKALAEENTSLKAENSEYEKTVKELLDATAEEKEEKPKEETD